MFEKFENRLSELAGLSIESIEPEDDSCWITLSDGARIYAGYWRLICLKEDNFSSFDHQQKYGLAAPIDAVGNLISSIGKQKILMAKTDRETGDLELAFENRAKLQIFNFTGNEAWEVEFPDGISQLSNYLKK